MSIKVKSDEVKKLFRDMPREKDQAWRAAGELFKSLTPVKSGNARRNTRVTDTEIHADYGYADRLDSGWSRQAPRGMSAETLKYFQQRIDRDLGK